MTPATDRSDRYGAAAGAVAIAMFLAASLVTGDLPDFDAGGAEIAAHADENRTQLQIASAIHAAWAPLFVWFLATVAARARATGPGAARAGAVAFGCGLVFLGLFLVDVMSIAIRALRPEGMAADPELASALRDVEWLAMGMAAPLVSGMLAAFAALALRDEAVWPRWLGWMAAAAAAVYLLRTGTLFTTDGAFAADGVLGLWAPVIAVAACVATASVTLALERVDPAAARSSRG